MAKNLKPVAHIPSGIINTRDPAGLPPGTMVEATNVDIWDNEAVRRPGRSVVVPGSAHSFWSDGVVAFFVQNGWLKQFDGSSATNLLMLTTSNPVDFERVNNQVVFSDGVQIGTINDHGEVESFPAPTDRHKIATRPGRFVAFYNGRLYVFGAQIMFTDPYDLAQMDRRKYRIPLGEGGFTMGAAVDSGLWISTRKKIYFLGGGEPDEANLVEVADYPVVEGAFSVAHAEKFFPEASGRCVFMATRQGFCVGFADGSFKNLSRGKVSIDTGERGTLALREINGMTHLVAAMQETVDAHNPHEGEVVTYIETTVS